MDVSLNGSCHGYSTILHGAHFHHKLLYIYIQILWARFSNFFLNECHKDSLEGKFRICARAQWWSSCTQNHPIIQAGVGLRTSLVTPLVQSRVSFQTRPGYLGLYPDVFWKTPRLETAQLFLSHRLVCKRWKCSLGNSSSFIPSFLWLGSKALLYNLFYEKDLTDFHSGSFALQACNEPPFSHSCSQTAHSAPLSCSGAQR